MPVSETLVYVVFPTPIYQQNISTKRKYTISAAHFKIKDSGNGIYSLSSTCYHEGPNNLVCFEAVGAPGQYLGMSKSGAACKPRKVTPDQAEAQFFVRVQVRY